MVVRSGRAAGAVMVAVVLSLGAGCGSSPLRCVNDAGAKLCVRKVQPGLYKPEASGLRPGSLIDFRLTGGNLPDRGTTSLEADSAGAYPGDHPSESAGMVIPAGYTDVSVTMTATAKSGRSVTATFKNLAAAKG